MVKIINNPEKELRVYLNLDKESLIVNRIKKFLRHPVKYISHQFYKLGISNSTDRHILTCFGTWMRVPLWDQNAVILYYTGTLAPEELAITRFLINTLNSSDVFYDVGANIGYFSSLALALGAKVRAFEANEKIRPYLFQNANQQGVVEACAVSDKNGEAIFYDTSESGKSGMSSLIMPRNKAEQRTVPTTTLDIYATTAPKPSVIKIDVEGAELNVLMGARELIEESKPTIIMEVLRGDKAHTSQAAISFLTSYGYEVFQIRPDGTLDKYTDANALNLVFRFPK